MNIIFGDHDIEQLQQKYLLLPLDRIRVEPQGRPIQSWCVITQQDIGIEDITRVGDLQLLHEKLMYSYGKKDWSFCERAIEELQGKFLGTLDSFYQELSSRIAKYKQQDPGPDWDGTYDKIAGDD